MANSNKVYRYKESRYTKAEDIALNIESAPLATGNSIAIHAIQFILYTNPKEIYLVGLDCSYKGNCYFTGENSFIESERALHEAHLLFSWYKIKKFCELYYPTTNITSINPIGLKHLFHNKYTDQFKKNCKEIYPNHSLEFITKLKATFLYGDSFTIYLVKRALSKISSMNIKNFYVYCANPLFKIILEYIDDYELNVVDVFDKKAETQDYSYCGFRISNFMRFEKIKDNDCILIASISSRIPIKTFLLNQNPNLKIIDLLD